LTKAQQDKLTPDEVLKRLKAGNKRFYSNSSTVRDHKIQIRKAVKGQHPKAIVLSCVDSRVPVEDVFDQGIGDIFVTRVAGNFVNDDILGSMEYAAKVAGVKLVVVLGHEGCGAVKSAVDDVKLGLITQLLAKIKPAVDYVKKSTKQKFTSKNSALVSKVCHSNVKLNLERIRNESTILKNLEKSGKIKVVGAVYDMPTGKVKFL
jgi:carbonic anhydrase